MSLQLRNAYFLLLILARSFEAPVSVERASLQLLYLHIS
jgi:hypothetical protein